MFIQYIYSFNTNINLNVYLNVYCHQRVNINIQCHSKESFHLDANHFYTPNSVATSENTCSTLSSSDNLRGQNLARSSAALRLSFTNLPYSVDFVMSKRRFSTSSTCLVVASTVSGLRLIESIPICTKYSAISG